MFLQKISQNIDILVIIHRMRFHGNQLSWTIKHPFINLNFKYHPPGFVSVSTMLAPVISSLDEIYCTRLAQYKFIGYLLRQSVKMSTIVALLEFGSKNFHF